MSFTEKIGPKNLCKEENCDRPAFCRGWCQRHYRRLLTYGDPKIGRDFDEERSDELLVRLPPPPRRREGCDNPPIHRGYCYECYSAWHNDGHPLHPRPPRKR